MNMKYLILIVTLVCFNYNPLQALPTSHSNLIHEKPIENLNPDDRILSFKNLKERIKGDKKEKSSDKKKKGKVLKIISFILLGCAALLGVFVLALNFLWPA